MPLTECPDCGQTVSEDAPACPACGSPVAKKVGARKKAEERERWQTEREAQRREHEAELRSQGYHVDPDGRPWRYKDITGKKKTGNEWQLCLLIVFCIALPWVGIPFTIIYILAPKNTWLGRFRDRLLR